MSSSLTIPDTRNLQHPTLGYSNIGQDSVDAVLDEIKKTYTLNYRELVNETALKLIEKPDLYKASRSECSKYYLLGDSSSVFIKIPNPYINDGTDEERYVLLLVSKFSILDETTPVGALAISINKYLCGLGFACSEIQLRLERGCLNPIPNYWHFDTTYPERQPSIIICWSNKPNWSTRIMNDENYQKISKGKPLPLLLADKDTEEKVKSAVQLAKFGYLYNAKEVFHRAPQLEDFNGEEISADDYRLFFHFY